MPTEKNEQESSSQESSGRPRTYRQMLDRVIDFMIEDLIETSDEDILKEAEEDGVDIEAEVKRLRALAEKCIERAKNPEEVAVD